ncbi:hypothetical protein LIER_43624 [Lithospermum erythrorhizon]|uniref:Uncharacterized protein n=1 Tax=Lithospermum erythrorhizon TaxID=34254 RepID=A0AAV3QI95_LITER
MAGGEQIWTPPPPEVLVLPPIQPSSFKSKPPHSQVCGQLLTHKDPSTIIVEDQSLEDGEIPPLLASLVPSIPCPQPIKLSQPLSYSKIVQGHKKVLPISEVISVDPASLCQDAGSLKPLSLFEGLLCCTQASREI